MKNLIKVIYIKNSKELVINAGSIDGIKEGQKFLVYSLDGEVIKDLDTGEILGNLEVIKGTGVVSFLQEKFCTITSDMYTKPSPLNPLATVINLNSILSSENEEEKIHCSFSNPKIGDLVKPI
ncbi:MAG: hypothetical protein E6936_13665 [Clostridium perfringens]|nr:hypothetical protein [Clostridium perfringens]